MPRLLDGIDSPVDIKLLKREELIRLAQEIREEIIRVISRNGGHLASNLGVVELTIALHYVLNLPRDIIIWDVGHQCYAHKLLTGRRERFSTIRQYGGLSGFPKREESPYDAYNSGHSSTSISVALGMAVARDLKREDYIIVAIIGDGALAGGIAFEALNLAGQLKKDLVVILNDNEMSISSNVGALSQYLNRIIIGDLYNMIKNDIQYILGKVPAIGGSMLKVARRLEESLKSLLVPGMLFEELGFRYIGPIDGHNIDYLIETLEKVKRLKGSILVHVITKKGKGYEPAERDASHFHGTAPFNLATGKILFKGENKTFTESFSRALLKLAKDDKRVVAITAAMPQGTGLERFAREYPHRFFDVGIAEEHAVTFAAGLASQGFKPIVAIYSTFLQRAYDQILHDICLQNLPVVFAIDRAGLVGEDGPTHHGAFDLSYLRHIPNLVLMAPKDGLELEEMVFKAIEYEGPIFIRYPRGATLNKNTPANRLFPIKIGKAEVLREGNDLAIIGLGIMAYPSLEAAQRLAEEGIEATVVNARFIKPLDRELIVNLASRCRRLVTVEENVLQGGFGSALLELFQEERVKEVEVVRIGLPDEFIEHGSQDILRAKYGLTSQGILETIKNRFYGQGKGKIRQIAR